MNKMDLNSQINNHKINRNINRIKKRPEINNSIKKDNEDKKLKESCNDFEGILIQQMLKSMRKTLSGDGVFGNSFGKDIYQSMYDEHLSVSISRGKNNIGFGDALYEQLKRRGYGKQ